MNILMIVIALIGAYVLFVSVSYLLIRLIFPVLDVKNIDEEVSRVKARPVHRYEQRSIRKQKNLAY